MNESRQPLTSVRSRKGCLTCRSKKVKCDEQRSTCGRCRRLVLKCEWTTASQSLGRSKTRPKARTRLQKILPNANYADLDIHTHGSRDTLPESIYDEACTPLESTLAANRMTNLEEFTAYDGANPTGVWHDWTEELGFLEDFRDISNFESHGNVDENLLESATGFLQADASGHPSIVSSSLGAYEHRPSLESIVPASWLPTTSPLDIFSPGLSMQNIVLLPSFAQSTKESQALHYYKERFSSFLTTKTFRWSTHMVMLRHGSQTPMIMHLLIAASLMNMGANQHDGANIFPAAREHYKAGVRLLMEAMNSSAEPDHTSMLTAFFFLYKYMTEQKNTTPDAMTQFSQAVRDYFKKYNLATVCSKPLLSCMTSTQTTVITRDKQECLARLIVWIFYEDVIASVGGYGGLLASHLSAEPEQTNEIYQCSTTILESFWGSDYPETEIIDDIENGPILKFFSEVMMLYTKVNEACQSSTLASDADRIEAKILKLEARSRFLFRLTSITTQPRSRLMINADYMVSHFYALRIYKFRCFYHYSMVATTPPEVQSSIAAILQIAQRSFAEKQQGQMIGRFRLPLFMAGIETSDGIYKEWIRTKLKKVQLSRAFKRILEMQHKSGKRISMPLVKQIMWG